MSGVKKSGTSKLGVSKLWQEAKWLSGRVDMGVWDCRSFLAAHPGSRSVVRNQMDLKRLTVPNSVRAAVVNWKRSISVKSAVSDSKPAVKRKKRVVKRKKPAVRAQKPAVSAQEDAVSSQNGGLDARSVHVVLEFQSFVDKHSLSADDLKVLVNGIRPAK